MPILLIIKADSFHQAKSAARQHQVPIHDLAKNGGNLNEFRARTENIHALAVQRWSNETELSDCLPKIGFPPGTLLFYRLTD